MHALMQPDIPSASDAMTEAQTAWRAGDLPAVFDAANREMTAGRSTSTLLELLGHAFFKSGLSAEAAESYEAAARLTVDSFPLLKQASAAWTAAGNEEQAFLTALQAQKRVADDPDIVFTL